MLSAIAASAQYCSIQKGQKLYYEVLTGKKKAETYTSVVNVEKVNDSTFITLGDFVPKMNEKMKDTLFYMGHRTKRILRVGRKRHQSY